MPKLVWMTAHDKNATAATEPAAPANLANAHLPIHYPTHLIDIRKLRDGRRLTLRPVLPQDACLIADLIDGASEASRHQRFPRTTQPTSPQALAAMTCVDYRRHLALVIGIHQGGRERLVAEARYLIDDDGHAEVALLVDDRWQGSGLGTWAMLALSRAAEQAGAGWLRGDVRASNTAMLALMRRCGFCCAVDRTDPDIVHVETRPRALHAHRKAAAARRRLGWVQRLVGGRPKALTQY